MYDNGRRMIERIGARLKDECEAKFFKFLESFGVRLERCGAQLLIESQRLFCSPAGLDKLDNPLLLQAE